MLTRRLAFTAFLASGIATPAKRDVEFGAWRESMNRRWVEAESYASEVLSAMPDEYLNYSPVSQEFTFAKHLTHLGFYNVFLLSAIVRKGPPSEMTALMAPWEEPRDSSKQMIRNYLETTFRRAREITSSLNQSSLRRTGIKPGEEFTSVHTVKNWFCARSLTRSTIVPKRLCICG
jgi:hypothetical protein